MKHRVEIEGFESQNIEAQFGLFRPTLFVNGQEVQRDSSGNMVLQADNGETVVARWKTPWFDAPYLVVGNKTVWITPPMKWYQRLWCSLPLILLFIGGIVGGIIGLLAFFANMRVFWMTSGRARYVYTGLIFIFAIVIYLFVGGGVVLLLLALQ